MNTEPGVCTTRNVPGPYACFGDPSGMQSAIGFTYAENISSRLAAAHG